MKEIRKISICLIIISALFCNNVFCSDDLGYVSEGDICLNLVDSIAFFNEKEQELNIYFLPTKLTDSERSEIKNYNCINSFFNRKSSPNEKIWQWYPYASLTIKFDKQKTQYDIDSIERYYIIIWNLYKKNYPITYNMIMPENFRDAFKEYSFDLENKKLSLSFSGKWQPSNNEKTPTEWNFKAYTDIILGNGI